MDKEGESIEQVIRKATSSKEPIKGTAKLTYNDRKDGVLAQHDIRTDRWDVALKATDNIHATEAAKRQRADYGSTEDKPISVQTAEA